jgi:acyl-[acyl carrier protein]--UDP-N-acetylglucosamine O-acyltransferase
MTINTTAIVHPDANLGKNVSVGSFSVIHENVVIGDNTTIGSFCELGIKHPSYDSNLIVGENSVIRSHSVLYAGSKFGANLETGHHVSLREGILAGQNLRVGSYSDIQGDLLIGNFVRLHSSVHLGKHTQIGNFVWIFPFVVTTNDPQPPSEFVLGCIIEDYAAIATASILLPGVRIGHDSLIGANSTVVKDVEPFSLAVGSPARRIKDVRDLKNHELKNSYPWRQHFKRGYPPEVLEKWNTETFF